MLSQLIYTSQAIPGLSHACLQEIAVTAARFNTMVGISGLLVFDEGCFLQVLEGDAAAILPLYQKIKQDRRHRNVVQLIHEPIAQRRFAKWGMRLVAEGVVDAGVSGEPAPVQPYGSASSLDSWRELLTTDAFTHLTEDRVRTVLDAFTRGRWHQRAAAAPGTPPAHGRPESDSTATGELFIPGRVLNDEQRLGLPQQAPLFAFQPIVDFENGRISSYEALLRGPAGEPPHSVLGAYTGEALHRFDLHSKAAALAIARQLGSDARLSLNLLPESLLVDENAVVQLVRDAAACGFSPDRLVLEVTEEEAITDPERFAAAVNRVRAAGMRVAIDDFGAGYAGLSLLADFQPDKLKIDRCIVHNVHENGPRQAIVRAIVEFCYCLGISVVAEGVETAEEFHWLRSAGVHRIQGYLIARPQLCALPPVCWPG